MFGSCAQLAFSGWQHSPGVWHCPPIGVHDVPPELPPELPPDPPPELPPEPPPELLPELLPEPPPEPELPPLFVHALKSLQFLAFVPH